jgi:hypothetical protein
LTEVDFIDDGSSLPFEAKRTLESRVFSDSTFVLKIKKKIEVERNIMILLQIVEYHEVEL